MRTFLIVTILFSMSACTRIEKPNFLPSSYAYHGHTHTYKFPPGEDAREIGYEYSEEDNKKALIRFERTAQHLVQQINREMDLSDKAVFIAPANPPNAFMQAFDHALRQAMIDQGYLIANGAETFYARINYTIQELNPASFEHQLEPDDGIYHVNVDVFSGAETPHVISQNYTLPNYGASNAD